MAQNRVNEFVHTGIADGGLRLHTRGVQDGEPVLIGPLRGSCN